MYVRAINKRVIAIQKSDIISLSLSQNREHEVDRLTLTIQKCVKGDRAAFKSIYDQFKRYAFTICYRYMANQVDAEEVMQQGFIKIHRDLYQFNPEKGNFKSWLNRVFANTALEALRKRKHIQVELEDTHATENFEDTIFEKLTVNELTKIIALLSDGYRTAINMYIIEGYSHKEIAQKLNTSVGTSKSQLHKAKTKLRCLVLENYPELASRYGR